MYAHETSILDAVLAAVKEAGRLLTDPAAVREIHAKGATDYVTNVDLRVEETLKARLAQLTPAAQFMGEEQDNAGLDLAKPCWILDPVDGTTNLIHRFSFSAISLALAEEGRVVFGVVYDPFHGECFTARAGRGSFLNGNPIRVSAAATLGESLISVGTAPGHRTWADDTFRLMRRLFDACQDVRRMGCASLDLCYVACGRQDGFVEQCLQPWDYAAGLLIVAEAGGQATDLTGACLPLNRRSGVAASNGLVHGALLAQLP